jgi:hypothetical protein
VLREFVGYTRASDALIELESGIDRFSALVTDIDLRTPPNSWELARRARALPRNHCLARRAIDWPHAGVLESVMLQKPFAAARLTALAAKLNQKPGGLSEV